MGWPDIVAGDTKKGVQVFFNNGAGHFDRFGTLAVQAGYGIEEIPYSMAVADLNRDGHSDIVLGNAGAKGRVLLNAGDGRSFSAVDFGDGAGSVYGLAVGDFDGDGYPDIAAALDLIVGVWHGVAIQGAGGVFRPVRVRVEQSYDIDLSMERSESGALGGRTVYSSATSIARCSSVSVFQRDLAKGVHLFAERFDGCGQPAAAFALQVIGENKLRLLFYGDDQQSPALTVVLDRKSRR